MSQKLNDLLLGGFAVCACLFLVGIGVYVATGPHP